MLQSEATSLTLRSKIAAAAGSASSYLHGVDASVRVADLLAGGLPGREADELSGRSVLLVTGDQVAAASALIALDGLAGRIVLCPPGVPVALLAYVMGAAEADALVTDRSDLGAICLGAPVMKIAALQATAKAVREERRPSTQRETEWVLLTSGTTGLPKLVVHTPASLTGAIEPASRAQSDIVWSTFYDIRRYGGLQILLRSLVLGASMVFSSANEAPAEFLVRAAAHGATHLSGTPSHWRKALMSPEARRLKPRYIRLSGEIADQGILNQLRSVYPEARIAHAFASTEAGVALEVEDGCAGFPASLLDKRPGVDLKVEDGSLRVRSSRTASRYLGGGVAGRALMDEEGFVDTSDMLELREGRYYFSGRRDGVINVGGLKVHPEEVEAVINQHAAVHMSLVRAKKNPITGSLVMADVVLKPMPALERPGNGELQKEILLHCRARLAPYKVPAVIHVVTSLEVAASGKLERHYA